MEPIEAAYLEMMNGLARDLNALFNGDVPKAERKVGFALLVFPFDEPGRVDYISNGADRSDMIVLLRETIARLEGQPQTSGRA